MLVGYNFFSHEFLFYRNVSILKKKLVCCPCLALYVDTHMDNPGFHTLDMCIGCVIIFSFFLLNFNRKEKNVEGMLFDFGEPETYRTTWWIKLFFLLGCVCFFSFFLCCVAYLCFAFCWCTSKHRGSVFFGRIGPPCFFC